MQPLPLNPIVEQGILFSQEVITGPNLFLYYLGLTMIILGGCVAGFLALASLIKLIMRYDYE
jgi:hypothetical protein